MYFWEREIYIKLLSDHNEEERIKTNSMQQGPMF
jgi:hypothetical protein